MVKHPILGLCIFLLTCLPLFSEVDLDATLNGSITVNKVGDGDITSSGVASGNLTVKSTGSKYVKSQLTLDFVSMRNFGVLSIDKAWIKIRFPILRVTIGKNRITWGEGIAFNAGDVIFDDYIVPGGNVQNVDLTSDELRSVNRTMAQVIFPLGRFTSAEIIYLPYDFFTTLEMSSAAIGVIPDDKNFNVHSYGGRFVTKAAGMKLETGYIFNGDSELHKPYISINGTLGVDYHFSSSINITHGSTNFEDWKETWKISAGSFYMFDLEDGRTLTLRLEALIKPFEDWSVDALLLYPEISFIPNEEIALFIRAIINPLDINVTGIIGLNWKTYQGFSIGTFFTAEIQEDVDPNLSLSAVVTHKF